MYAYRILSRRCSAAASQHIQNAIKPCGPPALIRRRAAGSAIAVALFGLTAGCSPDLYSCEDIEREAISISTSSDDLLDLIKIKNSRMISQSEGEVRCQGTGVYVTGEESELIYRAYNDDDGELMFEYQPIGGDE